MFSNSSLRFGIDIVRISMSDIVQSREITAVNSYAENVAASPSKRLHDKW
jgi:hypothetical protein